MPSEGRASEAAFSLFCLSGTFDAGYSINSSSQNMWYVSNTFIGSMLPDGN